MYISNVQWRGGIFSDLYDAVCVAWGCYRGCPDCTIARGGGWVALLILRDKHSLGARECGLADLLRTAVPDGLSLPHLHLNIFFMILYLNILYLNSRVIHAYKCTNSVDLPCLTGAGPASVRCYKHRADSGPVVVCCDTPTRIWKQMMEYCELHWLHSISGVTSCWWWCLR